MKALLDTCVFLWLNADLEKIPLHVRDVCATRDNELYLSAASAWEVALKWKSGRLILPEEPSLWIPSRREKNGVETLPITEEDAFTLAKLPPLHKDPFDRMLVCQALSRGLVIVTPDPLIRQYPARMLW